MKKRLLMLVLGLGLLSSTGCIFVNESDGCGRPARGASWRIAHAVAHGVCR